MRADPRSKLGYWVARRLLARRWAVAQPRLWRWMEGQFARRAEQGDVEAQSFYGHILLFRGVGLGAKAEGARLLRLAADAGDAKAAYQLGVLYRDGDLNVSVDAAQAVRYWRIAAEAGHPLAARRLAELYRSGAAGLAPDAELAGHFEGLAAKWGL